jgi:uncharacterized protein with FMN-binding domain
MTRQIRGTSLGSAQRITRMRRVVAMGGMLAAVGGLVTLRSALTPSPSQALGTSGLAVSVGGVSASSGATSRPHHKGHSAQAAANPPAHRQVVGNAYDVGYGVVQVRVTLDGTRITDVSPVSLPQGARSGDISNYAAPQLRREALSAQSARIDTVSGASYTSAGYAESLQSALDKSAGG